MGGACSCIENDKIGSPFFPTAIVERRKMSKRKNDINDEFFDPEADLLSVHLDSCEGRTTPLAKRADMSDGNLEELLAHEQGLAVRLLVESFELNEAVIPSVKWRKQFSRVPGIGKHAAAVIAGCMMHRARMVHADDRGRQTDHTALVYKTSPTVNLVVLNLSSLKIGDEGISILGPAIANDMHLRRLYLQNNDITDAGMAAFMDCLSGSHSRIETLALSGIDLTSGGIATVARGVRQLNSLKKLEVGLGQSGVLTPSEETSCDRQAKVATLHSSTEIRSDATMCNAKPSVLARARALSCAAIHELARSIRSSSTLETFIFNGAGHCRPDFLPESLCSFLSVATVGTKLKRLCLNKCYTTQENVSEVSLASLDDSARHSPHLVNGKRPSEPTSSMCPLLAPITILASIVCQPKTSLRVLELRFPLSDDAASILCSGLAKATVLETLVLQGCSLSAGGLEMVGTALAINRSITQLDVSYQSSAVAHPMHLGDASHSPRNTYIASSGDTRVADGGTPLKAIIAALHTNCVLEYLHVAGIRITTEDVEDLCAAIEYSGNHAIKFVSYTSIGCAALNMKLEGLLATNKEHKHLMMAAEPFCNMDENVIHKTEIAKDKAARMLDPPSSHLPEYTKSLETAHAPSTFDTPTEPVPYPVTAYNASERMADITAHVH